MSVLEFIAALKWPVTVLILAGFLAYTLRRSPGTRASVGEWLRHRDLRVSVAGQEVEATLAQAAGGIAAATISDDELAAELTRRFQEEQADLEGLDLTQYRVPRDDDLEATRRQAVESVMRSAARWGWNMAHRGVPQLPDLAVEWTDAGHPELTVEVRETRAPQPVDLFAPALAEMTRRALEAVETLDQARRQERLDRDREGQLAQDTTQRASPNT